MESNRRIPEDIIMFNILPRRPLKSLVRFKCVCKSWLSFVAQLKYHHRKLFLLSRSSIQSVDLDVESDEIRAVDLHLPFRPQIVMICSQLLLVMACCVLQSKEKASGMESVHRRIQVGSTTSKSERGSPPFRSRYSFEIYSRSSNVWQEVQILPEQIDQIETKSGFLVNGALYWKTWFRDNGYLFCAILCYDTIHEEFNVIGLPPPVENNFNIFGDFEGHLCVFSYYHDQTHVDKGSRK